ncbi:hypothetical protein [Borrelia sp. HM]|uniref:hypothetical protein n=1 Tax=Borrelia sp. HM TaxID=1882662 RepID=UPI001C7660C0|nr:hypothetical protein [Borrelia sp. HM]BCR21441.1 hypothetical protein BKFM_00001 [Borrelia sp. HM]
MFKNKLFAFFALLFSFIAGCKLFFTDDHLQQKSAQLLDNVNSMILNSSEKKDSNSNQNTSTSQNTPQNSQQLPNNTKIENEISEKPETLLPTKEGKLVAANPITDDTTANDPKKDVQLPKERENLTSIAQNNSTSTNSFSKKTPLSSIKGSNLNKYSGNNNKLKSETGDTYLIEHNSGPITFSENTSQEKISGSYSGTTKFEEDEQEEKDENEEEERLNKKEIANQKNAKENLHKAITLAQQIKEDLIQVETAHTMLSGSRSFSDKIKNENKEKLSQFSKDKLENDLKQLVDHIGRSLIFTKNLTNYSKNINTSQKFNEVKNEIYSVIINVENQPNNTGIYYIYKKLQPKIYTIISSLESIQQIFNSINWY